MKGLRKILTLHIIPILLMLIAFTMPLHKKTNILLIIALSACWLLTGNLKQKLVLITQNKFILLSVVFYLVFVLSLLYTKNHRWGIFELDQKVSLIIFPVVLGTIPQLSKRQMLLIYCSFILSCLLIVSYLFVYASFQFYFLNNEAAFSHPEFSKHKLIHLSYLAMYLIFSLCILYVIFEQMISEKKNIWVRGGFGVLFVFIFCAVIIITARTAIAVLLIVSTFLIARFFIRRFGIVGIGAIIIIPILAFLTFNKFSRVQQRIVSFGASDFQSRLDTWNCAMQIGFQNLFFGVGPGDKKEEMLNCYRQGKMQLQFEAQYNAHSQYLEIFSTLGVTGFFLFIANFIMPLYFNRKVKGIFLYFLFVLVTGLCMITESILELQWGVVYYSFFNSIIIFHWLMLAKNFNEEDKAAH